MRSWKFKVRQSNTIVFDCIQIAVTFPLPLPKGFMSEVGLGTHQRRLHMYILDVATSSGILKAKQKLGRTFNSDKLGGIAFTKISKLTMCSA